MAAIEHFGLGLVAKRFVPGVHLAVLLIATEFIDIVWIVFSIFGIESLGSADWSHSLLMSAAWSAAAGAGTFFVTRERRSGIAVGLLVFSHWIVDLITHPMLYILPEDGGLTLYPGGTLKVGLGLYSTLPGLIVFWLLLVVPGVIVYAGYRRNLKKATRPLQEQRKDA